MDKARAAIAVAAIFGLAGAAHAGNPLLLSDRQMDAVIAGSTAAAALQASATGRNTTIWTMVANIAADTPYYGFAQSRAAVLATGASADAALVSQSITGPYAATAETAGRASGSAALVSALDMTTAIAPTDRLAITPIGVTQSLAILTTFSTSARAH